MVKIFAKIIAQLSGFASILGLYFAVAPLGTDRPYWHWLAIGFFAVTTFTLIFADIRDDLRVRTRVFKSDSEITRYMAKWVKSSGRTTIFSRDLSWGSEITANQALLQKATRNELTIFLENKTAVSEKLKNNGASIILYGESGFVPESRFTIVGTGKQGARVAVGLAEGGNHIVYQFESGKHPIFALAKDLVSLSQKIGKSS